MTDTLPVSPALMAAILPLLDKRLEDLTVADAARVIRIFDENAEVEEEILAAGVALLAGEDIHTVADMIQTPKALATIVDFVGRGLGLKETAVVAPGVEHDGSHVALTEDLGRPIVGWRPQYG